MMKERLRLPFRDVFQGVDLTASPEFLLVSEDPCFALCEGDDIGWEFDDPDRPQQTVRLGSVVSEAPAICGKAFLVRLSHIPVVGSRGSLVVTRRSVEVALTQTAVK